MVDRSLMGLVLLLIVVGCFQWFRVEISERGSVFRIWVVDCWVLGVECYVFLVVLVSLVSCVVHWFVCSGLLWFCIVLNFPLIVVSSFEFLLDSTRWFCEFRYDWNDCRKEGTDVSTLCAFTSSLKRSERIHTFVNADSLGPYVQVAHAHPLMPWRWN
jgi:hypothetical protein